MSNQLADDIMEIFKEEHEELLKKAFVIDCLREMLELDENTDDKRLIGIVATLMVKAGGKGLH